MGRFDGTLWTREQAKKVINDSGVPSWVQFVVVHAVSAPNMKQARETPYTQNGKMVRGSNKDKAFAQRMKNFSTRIKDLGGRGWHFTVFENGKIGEGESLSTKGIHANSWNSSSYGIEMCMDGDSSDPKTPGGQVIIDTTAWLCAAILQKRGLQANSDTVRFHNDEAAAKKKGKTCPGKNVDEAALLKQVQTYMAQTAKPANVIPISGTTAPNLGTVLEWQQRLKMHGIDPGPLDGLMGPKTKSAIQAFQLVVGVEPNGMMGPWVLVKLRDDPAEPTPKVDPPAPVEPAPVEPRPVQPKPVQPKPLEPVEYASNAKWAQAIYQREGWRDEWAWGTIGNLQRESFPALRPEVEGDWMLGSKIVAKGTYGAKPTAFGVGQWREDRKVALDAFAAKRGKPWTDFETQILFVINELKTTEKLAWKWLQMAETIEQSTAAMVLYERPRGYNPSAARSAKTWDEIIAVAKASDGWAARLKFATGLASH